MKLELATECWQCDGSKKIFDKKSHLQPINSQNKYIPCPQCNGKGFIIESDGQAVIDFIEKVFGIKPK